MNKIKFLFSSLLIVLFSSNLMIVSAQVLQDWVSIFNNSDQREDFPTSLAIDNSGNVYVTGYTSGMTTGNDYLTIKYNSYGDTMWVRRYNNIEENGSDKANSIVVDDSGNVYVTGSRTGLGTYEDFFTIKYNSQGDVLWTQTWDSEFHYSDVARKIALDSFGNVYVIGASFRGGSSWDVVTIKYSSYGVEQWQNLYADQSGGFDIPYSIAIDHAGNAIITGRTGENGYGEYLTIKYGISGDTLWVRKYDLLATGVDEAFAIAVDDIGNAYVTGRSLGLNSAYEYATIKYSSIGEELWVQRYNGSLNSINEAYAIAVDNLGNVYVTGQGSILGSGIDYVTIKYNTDGVQQWIQNYNGPGSDWDIANSIALDEAGNIYVTGQSSGGSPTYTDFATVKYSTDGVEKWSKRYNGSASSVDYGRCISVDDLGNVYVVGESVGIGTSYDYATIKYSELPTDVEQSESYLPKKYLLEQNYPNPFNPSTKISYAVPNESNVSIIIYDLVGQELATIVNDVKSSGYHEVIYNASELSSGIYFYRIKAISSIDSKEFTSSKKFIVLK